MNPSGIRDWFAKLIVTGMNEADWTSGRRYIIRNPIVRPPSGAVEQSKEGFTRIAREQLRQAMITVTPVTVISPSSRHPFPALDFELRNTGHVATVLRKFCIVVEEIAIDPQPVLSARVGIQHKPAEDRFHHRGGILCALVTNNGWGAALDCELTLHSPILNILFPSKARHARVTIPSGSRYELLLVHELLDHAIHENMIAILRAEAKGRFDYELASKVESLVKAKRAEFQKKKSRVYYDNETLSRFLSDPENCKRFEKEPAVRQQFRMDPYRDAQFDEALEARRAEAEFQADFERQWGLWAGVPIEDPEIRYSLRDERGRQFEGTLHPNMGGNIEVTAGYFVFHERNILRQASVTDRIYSCIVDVDCGAHTKEYGVSQVVPPGYTEHCQIVIGATKSVRMKLRLQFYVDKSTPIESESVSLELLNPRNSRLHDRHEDGDVIWSLLRFPDRGDRQHR